MSVSVNEDRQQSMEESNAMTIEFLRARLLSERSVSKSARQRADELGRRVAELEEQLKFVSLQRKKAEKATANVLAIMENHGGISEEFDSCSDQDESPRDFNAHKGSLMIEVTSNKTQAVKNEMDTYSSSEVESSPSTGRSLSWRSSKESQHCLEKKRFMDPVRRITSFSSNSLSARKVGKSCRRIRHRETRLTESFQDDNIGEDGYFVDVSDGSNNELVALRESSKYEIGKKQLASTTLGSNCETQKMRGLYANVYGRDENMESALQHQARLIGQHEEEEKAQREWEEKFTDCTQDSGDPGNHSDVTEERYEMKSPESYDEMKQELVDADKRRSKDSTAASEFSVTTSNTKDEHYSSMKNHEALEHTPLKYSPLAHATTHGRLTKTSYEEQSMPLDLGSVLEALQRAKSSLNKKINNSSLVSAETYSHIIIQPSNTELNKTPEFHIPFATPGIFKLPTDYQFEPSVNPRIESQSRFSGDSLLTAPYRSFPQEIRPRLDEGPSTTPNRLNNLYPYTNDVLPDMTLHLPMNEWISSTFPCSSSESELPSIMGFSAYDEYVRPNMYR